MPRQMGLDERPTEPSPDDPKDGPGSADDLGVLTEILAAFRKVAPDSRERLLNTVDLSRTSGMKNHGPSSKESEYELGSIRDYIPAFTT
jgi:hypothetical protein